MRFQTREWGKGVSEDQTFVGLRLSDRYRVMQPLARGGLCVVYNGQDEPLRRPVAIKAVSPSQVPAYRAALRATSALTHPAGIFVLDAVEHDGWLFLIQEHVDSTPLSAELHNGLAVERALDVGVQLARFLAYAHAHDVVHGDVTPPAVLLERGGMLRLNNFALPPDRTYLARFNALDELLSHSLQIAADMNASAPPPDENPASTAEDVRAVGLLLWQALATAAPTGASHDFRADVTMDVRHLVARMIVRTHPRRLVSADEAAAELAALAQQLGTAREEELQPTPPALHLAREAAPHGPASSWATADTVVDTPAWVPSSTPPAYGPPGSSPAAYDATPTRPAVSSRPMAARNSAGPARTAPPSGVLHGSPSGNLRSYGPASQPASYRPTTPLPWSDDPQIAQWAAEGTGRPYGLGPSSGNLPLGPARPGMGVAPVVLIGILLFVVCFIVGYFMPLIITIR